MNYCYRSRQRGLALIMAVLIAALAVTAIAFAAWRQQVRLRSVEVRADSAQAQLLLRASITIARTALIDDLRADRNSNNYSDDPTEQLFTHREETDVEKGHASGFIEDASGRFNLNELRDGQGDGSNAYRFESYQRLLALLSLDPELAFTLADWLDQDDQPLPNGAEDMYYLAQDPPRRTGNRDLSDLSELLQIKGYTPEVIAKLKPFIDVFPVDMPSGTNNGSININFCSPELLSAMMGVLDKSEASALLREVRQQPYQNFGDFYARLPKDIQDRIVAVNGLQGNLQNQLTAQTRFFYANLKLDYGRVHWSERVLLRRNDANSTPKSVEVVRRMRLAE